MFRPPYKQVLEWVTKVIDTLDNKTQIETSERLLELFRREYIPEGLSGLMRARYDDYNYLVELLKSKKL